MVVPDDVGVITVAYTALFCGSQAVAKDAASHRGCCVSCMYNLWMSAVCIIEGPCTRYIILEHWKEPRSQSIVLPFKSLDIIEFAMYCTMYILWYVGKRGYRFDRVSTSFLKSEPLAKIFGPKNTFPYSLMMSGASMQSNHSIQQSGISQLSSLFTLLFTFYFFFFWSFLSDLTLLCLVCSLA